MKLSYRNNKLEKSLTTDKGLAKTYGNLAKKIKQRLIQLESSENLEVISKYPVLRLHQHIGKDKGTWSIDIQENWRILFEIDHNPLPTLEDGGIDLKAITIIKIESVKDPH
ncbi:killer suppression protein HigA [Brumimicrobium glaciale]|uniref:Killer suppression protein HigA n=1 Tax=Brumimicrobium glaciale TaxID=200475 RepID=A0A4Q4KR41_9FLAO|nr:type II toxin-antitoxin system RelE/ParE family toxin [Brumimicrobium glaciale]RYM35877.1 killer suppression protein HigA [Brumimicrobium glaciale]